MVTITVSNLAGEEQAYFTISIELICDPSDPDCDDDDVIDNSKSPAELELTVPVCSTQLDGVIYDDPETDIWYVDHRYYRLTQVTMWKDGGTTSGFSVTYEVPDDFTGWTTETHMFGYTTKTDNLETITLDTDL